MKDLLINVFQLCSVLNPKLGHSFTHSLTGSIHVVLVHWLSMSLSSLRGFRHNMMPKPVPLLLPVAGFRVFNYTLYNWVTTSKISYLNIKLQDINITKQPLGTQHFISQAKEHKLFLLREKTSVNAYELRSSLRMVLIPSHSFPHLAQRMNCDKFWKFSSPSCQQPPKL